MNTSATPSQNGLLDAPTSKPAPGQTPPETSASTLPTSQQPQRSQPDKLKAISDLLGGGPPSPEAGDGAAAPQAAGTTPTDAASPKSPKPKALLDLAETLGMEPKDLYGLEITVGDDEVVSVGALKDAYKNQKVAGLETTKRAADLDVREAALVNRQLLWDELGADLSRAINPQTRAKIEQHMAEQEAQERDRFLTALPEYRDQTKFDGFRDDVVKTLQGFGYSVPEMNIRDHRQLLVLRDLIQTKKRLNDLLAYSPKQDAPKAAAPQGRGSHKAPPATGRAANKTQAVSRISALLAKRG